jgi:hypothetical protein
MRQIKFSDVAPHLLAMLVFLVVTLIFFSPIFFENRELAQSDIQQHMGSSKALRDYRDATGEEGLWAESMFSGMPAYLVNLQWSDGVVVTMKKVLSLFLPHPVRNIYAAFACYYIMLLAFRVRPYLAIAGALAFGLSSYMIIGLEVGHNARIGAIAFMPLVMAGIHLAFTGKRVLGFGVTAAGLSLHLRENHLQITYYLLMIVVVYGLVQLVAAWREKQLNAFAKSLMILVPAALIAVATFFGQFWAITEYTRYSIRGPSELVKPGQKSGEDGLTKEYAFAYTYGVLEPMTLLIPAYYGGSSGKYFVQDQKSSSYKALMNSGNNEIANQLAGYTSAYWGPQSFTAGPYYGGAIIVFLFVLGMLFAERKFVIWLVPLSALSLMLSWGDSFSSFNYLMFDYLPGYNKFRSVSFALVIILFAMPLLGMIGLDKVLTIGINPETRKKLIVAAGATAGLCLLIILFAGMGGFSRETEAKLPAWFLNALRDDRRSLLRADAFRSMAFILSIFVVLVLNVPKKISQVGFYAFLIFMVTVDLAAVDKRYFTKDNYQRRREVTFEASPADLEILKDKGHYRVYNFDLQSQNPMAEAATSYYHRSLGGYHGAKLQRYRDLYDSVLYDETIALFGDARQGKLDFKKYGAINMLNTKYIMYGTERNAIIPNFSACGPAWFVKQVITVGSPNEELKKVAEINTREMAVVDKSKFPVEERTLPFDSTATITLIDEKPNWLKYESQSTTDGFAIFSEIYYPKGWHAFIDEKEVSILRADFVLRALEVPAGKHVIEFKFEPKPYTIGNKVTFASSWVLLIAVLASLGMELRKKDS